VGFFFQAEDGIRDFHVTEFRRVLFRSRLRSELDEISSNGALSKTPELESLLERLRDRVAQASEVIGETSQHASQRIARVATDADDYVHEEPWRFATMAALAGVALGVLIARR